MDSLFDQLKAGPVVNNRAKSPVPIFKPPKAVAQPVSTIKDADSKVIRRESMPPPSTSTVIKNSHSKSRSLSPPKNVIKSLKVKVERTKLMDSAVLKQIENACKRSGRVAGANVPTSKRPGSNATSVKDRVKAPKLVTPTKAQQKLFDPDVLVKAQQLTKLKIKRCVVRLPKQDLKKLQNEMRTKNKNKKNVEKLSQNSPSPNKGNKRKNNSSSSSVETSPATKRKRNLDAIDSKQSTGFFIKLNELTKRPSKNIKKMTDKKKYNTAAAKAANAFSTTSTKPTKFTRTQLIKLYGNRYFRAHVKIERCTHPMMLIFESNARARRMQSKRNKSKNLSVSFREQVEIFGDSSDSESETGLWEEQACTSQSLAIQSKVLPSALLAVTPARLKKVENGKVVDDIELDTSLFIVPTAVTASTPYTSPGRKRREKKSFSPLKGDGTPSPRKEQLKLANEKMPPSGLRRLPADEVDEEDDEDDECEYIVPIEIPERRTSRTNSCNITEEITSKMAAPTLVDEDEATPRNSSGESFASAIEEPATSDREISKDDSIATDEANATTDTDSESVVATVYTNGDRNTNNIVENNSHKQETVMADKNAAGELTKLARIGSESPAQSLNSLNDLVDTLMKNVAESQMMIASGVGASSNAGAPRTNIDNTNEHVKLVPELLNQNDSKLRDTLDDDISLQLFAEDDPDNVTGNSHFLTEHLRQDSEIVDGIVKERIGELSVGKQLPKAALATDAITE